MPEEAVEQPTLQLEPGEKKSEIRTKVWNFLRDNKVATFPKPPHRRISNFVGSDVAGNLAATLDVFKNATNVRIDPDRPLMQIRLKTLEEGKTLFVPMPGMRNHVMSCISSQAVIKKRSLRSCMTRQGVVEYGEPVDIDKCVKIDLVVVGCVAVSPRGWRIGKGTGLSDLEYAMIRSTNSVDNSVPVITLVHDCQVIDLPADLFTGHDVPVDYIVTPTRVIKCCDFISDNIDQCPTKPAGIMWSILTSEALNRVPVLRRLRYREWKAGKDVHLGGEPVDLALELTDITEPDDVPTEEELKQGRRGSGRRNAHLSKSLKKNNEVSDANGEMIPNENETSGAKRFSGNRRFQRGQPRRRNLQRRNEDGSKRDDTSKKTNGEVNNQGGDGHHEDAKDSKKQNSDGGKGEMADRKYSKRKIEYAGAVYVGALPRSTRVSEFKAEVRERKVNPLRVLWRGSSGFAFLNFKTAEDAELALKALSGLQLSDKMVRLEMARSTAQRTDDVPRRGNGYRRVQRQRRLTRRGASDTGENGSATVKEATPQHLPERSIVSADDNDV